MCLRENECGRREHSRALPPPQGAEPLLCLDGIISGKLFSPNGKMLVGFASYFVFTFEVALVHLPVFTESCIWMLFL